MSEIKLDELTKGEVRNLSGQERGVEARAMFNLDELDSSNDEVKVIVPDDLDAIASSFFQGMFASSVRNLGGGESFLRHYRFNASPEVMLQVMRGIERVETDRDFVLH